MAFQRHVDPNANLTEQLFLVDRIQSTWADCCGDGSLTNTQAALVADHAARLAELVVELHTWIQKKGTLPQPWQARINS
jgi:hypothetical protein